MDDQIQSIEKVLFIGKQMNIEEFYLYVFVMLKDELVRS